jgi:23S rRNA pseudouridine2605 synthase
VTVPLERALSKLGLATRSEARTLIVGGRVRVNGRTVKDPLTQVVPERIALEIDGSRVRAPQRVTIALHKPRGVVTTRRDPEGRTTVYDLLREFPHHVVPVGRLDYATSGLILLTNDTRLADWLTDPAHEVKRVYLVTVRGRVTNGDLEVLERGVAVPATSRPARRTEVLSARKARIRKASQRETHLVLELTEGRNREIRRLLAAIDHDVTRLRRVQFGAITLGNLAPGAWRTVGDAELRRAFAGAFSEKKLPTPVSRR